MTNSASSPSRSCSCIAIATPTHEREVKQFLGEALSETCSSRPRMSCRRSIVSSSAARPSSPMPISVRACAVIFPRWKSIWRRTGFDGALLIVQSTGGLVRGRAGAQPLCPDAEVRSGRGCHRHACAVPRTEYSARDRVRHGRHDRKGRRHLQWRSADYRRGADRRLRAGACRSRSR